MRLLLTCVVFSAFILASAQTKSTSVYLLAREDGGWCGFASENVWNAEKSSGRGGQQVGRVDYLDGQAAFVYVTTPDETGDWTTYDKYTFDKGGTIVRLERTIVIPEGFKQEQLWSIQAGHPTKQKSMSFNIAKNEVVPDGTVQFPDPETVVANPRDFPFWPLAHDRRPEILANGRACLDVTK